MVKRLKHGSMDDMDSYGKPKKRYHQTRKDRTAGSEVMLKHMRGHRRPSSFVEEEIRKMRPNDKKR